MYINRAYLGKKHEDIADLSAPLLVTAVGNFRLLTRPVLRTSRKEGRRDYLLIYVASGRAHFYRDGKETVLSRGNMVLFRPGEPQRYDLFARDRAETYWVHFTGGKTEELLERYSLGRGENVFFTGASPHFSRLFCRMIEELQLRRAGYADMLALTLTEILLLIDRSRREGKLIGSDMVAEVERAAQYFRENYRLPISVGEYARERHMTPCWFIRNFKKITRVTPAQYVLSLRIDSATELLARSDSSVTEIAASVGYDNPLYFSRLFRRHVGCSPSEYRKRGAQ